MPLPDGPRRRPVAPLSRPRQHVADRVPRPRDRARPRHRREHRDGVRLRRRPHPVRRARARERHDAPDRSERDPPRARGSRARRVLGWRPGLRVPNDSRGEPAPPRAPSRRPRHRRDPGGDRPPHLPALLREPRSKADRVRPERRGRARAVRRRVPQAGRPRLGTGHDPLHAQERAVHRPVRLEEAHVGHGPGDRRPNVPDARRGRVGHDRAAAPRHRREGPLGARPRPLRGAEGRQRSRARHRQDRIEACARRANRP